MHAGELTHTYKECSGPQCSMLACLHHVHKLLKAHICIVWAWGCLWVVLDGHGLLLSPHHASASAIIQVDVGHLHTSGQGLWVHSKVVVLGADLNAPCSADSRGSGWENMQ